MNIINSINYDLLIEKLADIEHDSWSKWMNYLFAKSIKNEDGTYTIPKWAVDRWTRQLNTLYQNLNEEEKESDRKEARKFLDCIIEELNEK